jgi:hypothetical protein
MNSYYIDNTGCYSEDETNQKIEIIPNPNSVLNGEKIIALWNKYKNTIQEKSDNICRGEISTDYLDNDKFKEIEYIIVLLHLEKKRLRNGEKTINSIVMGFVLCKSVYYSNYKKGLYVDVICANTKEYNFLLKGGKILLNEAQELARDKGYSYVELSSLPHVLSYYRKIGFSHIDTDTEVENDEIQRLGDLNKSINISSTEEIREIINIEKALQESNTASGLNDELLRKNLKIYLNLDEIPDDMEVMEYLSMIPEYVAKNNGKDGLLDLVKILLSENMASSCRNNELIKEDELFNKDDEDNCSMNCLDDGFLMRKSVDDPLIILCEKQHGGNKYPSNIYMGRDSYKSKASTKKYSKRRNHKTRKQVPWAGWAQQKPTTHQRTVMLKRCGHKCFLGPRKSFPVCTKNTCKINSKGAYAAYVRARQWGKKPSDYKGKTRPTHRQSVYKNVARKAKKILTRRGFKVGH